MARRTQKKSWPGVTTTQLFTMTTTTAAPKTTYIRRPPIIHTRYLSFFAPCAKIKRVPQPPTRYDISRPTRTVMCVVRGRPDAQWFYRHDTAPNDQPTTNAAVTRRSSRSNQHLLYCVHVYRHPHENSPNQHLTTN